MKRSSETDLVINLWPPNTLSTRTYNVRKISSLLSCQSTPCKIIYHVHHTMRKG